MILVDTNLLIYARVKAFPQHVRARDWLDTQLSGGAPVGLPWASLLGFLRIVTNPRVFERPEPIAEASAKPLGDDSLVLVPGVAFDPTGGRLGRGRGAWDRALGERGGAGVFGVAFEFQVIDLVPREAHDRPVDALLTEAGIRRVSRP